MKSNSGTLTGFYSENKNVKAKKLNDTEPSLKLLVTQLRAESLAAHVAVINLLISRH